MDFIQKKINSILFRLVLIAFAIVLALIHTNTFEKYVFVIVTVVYFILFFLFLGKYSVARLLNDFAYMNLCLIGKDPNDTMVFTFLILPIINSINFSGSKRSFLLYILTVVTFVIQLCYFNDKIEAEYVLSNLYPLITILFLWLINWYTHLRIKIKNFREELTSVVDDYYLRKEEIKRPHKIYKQLIKVIDRNTKKICIEDIVCFTIHKDKTEKLILTNGSSFMWQFSFGDSNIINEIRKKQRLLNVHLIIDEKRKPYNLILYSKVQEQEYIYAFITKESFPAYYLVIGFFDRTLTPAFKKISTVLLSEKKLQDIRNEEVSKLSEKSQYVNRANKTMHYIRNRLGPFSNLIKMLEQFDKIPSDKIDALKTLISKETEMARTELNNITTRANNMLEKNKNPFVYTKLDPTSIERVFTTLKRNVYSYFPNTEIEISLQVNLSENRLITYLNEEGFELFLSDWLNNMLKYKREFVNFKFVVTNSALEISFCNDYHASKADIDKLVSDFTSDDRNEIMKRTTHGLYIIKLTLEDMNIPFEVFHDDSKDMLVFKLFIKTHLYENSSI